MVAQYHFQNLQVSQLQFPLRLQTLRKTHTFLKLILLALIVRFQIAHLESSEQMLLFLCREHYSDIFLQLSMQT